MSEPTLVNLPLHLLVVRRDQQSRVALEYFRGTKWSRYLAFDPRGVQKYELETAEFEKRFTRTLASTLEGSASAFLRSLKDAYLPYHGAADILLEILNMAKTNGTKDLSTMDTKELVAFYNQLAYHVPGTLALKGWKNSKAELVERIGKLQAQVKKPTAQQAQHAAEGEQKEAAKAPTRKAATVVKGGKVVASADRKKPVYKPVAEPKGDKPKVGIGALCEKLILEGKSTEEILAAVKDANPAAKTSAASVAWYRNKLSQEGKL